MREDERGEDCAGDADGREHGFGGMNGGDSDQEPRKRSTDARARVSVSDRVSTIVGMMERGQWERGKTGREMAAQWGIAESEVKRAAAEASRRVRSLVDADSVRVRIAGALDRALDAAEQQDDPKAVAAVAKVYGPLVGAVAPTRIEVDHSLPAWLPQELAPLAEYLPKELASPPTPAELAHLADALTPAECTLAVCRLHGRGDDDIEDAELVDDDDE